MKLCCCSFLICVCLLGCDSRYRQDLDYSYNVSQTWTIDEIKSGELAQFESVDFDLFASTTIRQAIAKDNVAASRDVLQIGCGTGLVAALCLLHDANRVVATDVRPAAVSNTRYNVAAVAPEAGQLITRLRPASQRDAFSAIESSEKFDLIITSFDQNHQLGDEDRSNDSDIFAESFLRGIPRHLRSGGRAIIQCSRPRTIAMLLELTKASKLKVSSLEKDFENRDWKSADIPLIPDVLFEVRPTSQTQNEPNP